MSFFISEELGIAVESTESGLAAFNKEDDDFTTIMSSEERRAFNLSKYRACTADEAKASARAKLAESTSAD